jgi:Zn-dependent protease with chaperone function
MYLLLCATLSLAVLLAIDVAASFLAALVWMAMSSRMETWTPQVRARRLFLLRITPDLAAVFLVAAFVVPSYLAYEPHNTGEIVALELVLMAAVSLCGIVLAGVRGLRSYRATRRLVRGWLAQAEPISLGEASFPAFRLKHCFPVLAVVGIFRPRLFIAEQVFGLLSAGEISAAVAHERGHLAAGDTIKRWLLRACRGMLSLLPTGRKIDRAWSDAAEAAADEHAARGNAAAALELASAMVKIARLVPHGAQLEMVAWTPLIMENVGGVTSRVFRLARIAEEPLDNPHQSARLRRLAMGGCVSGLCFALLMGVFHPALQLRIHSALEYLVSALQ